MMQAQLKYEIKMKMKPAAYVERTIIIQNLTLVLPPKE